MVSSLNLSLDKASLAEILTKHSVVRKCLLFVLVIFAGFTNSWATTKTATTTGNWSNSAIWSPAGVPLATDDIIINSGITVTVDGSYTCNSLDLGNNTDQAGTLKIIASGDSLTINGNLRINPNAKNKVFTLDAGPGVINVAGTFNYWANTGDNIIQVGTGVINFTPAVSLLEPEQFITFTGAGTINFLSHFTHDENKLTTASGCNINFYGNYNAPDKNLDWRSLGTANFYGTGTINGSSGDIKFNVVNIMPSANTTLATGSGNYTIQSHLSLNSGATFTANKSFELNGNLTNNGGTFSGGAITITMNGANVAINGSTGMSLPTVQVGKTSGSNDVVLNISANTTMSALTLSKANKNRQVVIGASKTLTVSGDVTLNQSGKDNYTSWIAVGNNTLAINGNLVFVGNNNSTKRVCRVEALAGSINLAGTITWMSNSAVATEVISITSGTLTFQSSITQGDKSGTIKVTSSGTINFNGTSAPSFAFGGGTAPVFTTASGSTINFNKGFTATNTALTFANGCNVRFLSTATITPSSTVTFANFRIDTGVTITAGGNFSLKGNWTNYGTFAPSTRTVTFNGSGTQTITNTSGSETFYGLTTSSASATVTLGCNVMVTNSLTLSGSKVNLNNYTLTLGNSAGASLSRTAGQVYGGTLKRWWPTGSITSTSGSYYGLFPVGTSSSYRPVSITSSSNPTTAGYVSVRHNNVASVKTVTYTDNEGSNIEAIVEMNSELTTTGLAGGTYSIDVKFTGLGPTGSVSNLKLVSYSADSIMGSTGTHVTTGGTVDAPLGRRSGVTASNLARRWVIGTNDRNATPLYRYVYSRKSGNWNDASATGTWSYTAGGSGAACSCLPTSSGYVVINAGHTVEVTANDSVKFVDVLSGGTLDIKNPRTLIVGGNLTLEGSATFHAAGTLKVEGELTLASTATTVSGDVEVLGTLTIPSGTSFTQSSGTLTISGDLSVNGALNTGSGVTFTINGSGTEIFGNGTITTASGGTISIQNHKSIREGSNLTFGSSTTATTLAIGSGATVNNLGTATIYGNITGGNASSTWVNNANSTLNVTGAVLSTGILDVETSPNTVNYNGSGAQTIKAPYSSYYVLKASNAGTKSLAADVQVDSLLNISDAAVVSEGSYIIFGTGGIHMNGTSELRLDRSTDAYLAPELSGDYDLLAGNVIINQTGDSAVVAPATYYNLTLNGTRAYDLSGVVKVSNDLTISNSAYLNSTGYLTVEGTLNYNTSGTTVITDSITTSALAMTNGTLNAAENAININGDGGWNRTGGTFIAGTGKLYFTGSDNQAMTDVNANITLNDIALRKDGGIFTTGGSVSKIYVTGDVELLKGTFDGSASTVDTIFMTGGNWSNDSATFIPGTVVVVFSDSADQAIQGANATQAFGTIMINKPTGTLVVGGATGGLDVYDDFVMQSGTFDEGSASIINVGGDWIKNATATFNPTTGEILFNGAGRQEIKGTATSHIFNNISMNKGSDTLVVSGSATALYATGIVKLETGIFSKGTADNIYVTGNWTNNAGKFNAGTGTVHFIGSTDKYVNGTATNNHFNHITINNSGATFAISDGDSVTLGGNVTLTAGRFYTGNNSVIILNSGNWVNNGGSMLQASSSVVFTSASGNQSIGGTASSQTFHNLKMSKPGRILSVTGSIGTISIGGDYDLLAGSFDKGTAANINVSGNWTNSGVFTQGTGTVTFNGSGAQAIGGDSITTFNNLTINKSADALTLNKQVNVNGALTLTSGIIQTSSSNMLKLGASATASDGSTASHISGPVKKVGNTDFVFPIGKDGVWRRAGVSGITNATTEVVAEYFNNPYSNTTTYNGDLQMVSHQEYWNISREVTADSLKVALYWEDAAASGINDCDYLTIAHWTGSYWENEAATAQGGAVCSGNGSGRVMTTGWVTSFSPFTFGGTGGNSLPVKLVSLNAKGVETSIHLKWVTAAEINNRGFEVLRSTDGENFEKIGWVDGNGNTTETITYAFIDANVTADQIYYYRLKQIDFDEQYEMTKIVACKVDDESSEIVWQKFIPNPASGETNLVVNSRVEGELEVKICSTIGQVVYHNRQTFYKGLYKMNIPLNNMPAGNYLAEIIANGKRYITRLAVK